MARSLIGAFILTLTHVSHYDFTPTVCFINYSRRCSRSRFVIRCMHPMTPRRRRLRQLDNSRSRRLQLRRPHWHNFIPNAASSLPTWLDLLNGAASERLNKCSSCLRRYERAGAVFCEHSRSRLLVANRLSPSLSYSLYTFSLHFRSMEHLISLLERRKYSKSKQLVTAVSIRLTFVYIGNE